MRYRPGAIKNKPPPRTQTRQRTETTHPNMVILSSRCETVCLGRVRALARVTRLLERDGLEVTCGDGLGVVPADFERADAHFRVGDVSFGCPRATGRLLRHKRGREGDMGADTAERECPFISPHITCALLASTHHLVPPSPDRGTNNHHKTIYSL
jgi:hypothetical protein